MEFQKLIEERRSIRSYEAGRTVDKETVSQLINSAIEAPSWKNGQTSRYYCIISEDMKERFRKECLPEFNAKNSENASALIVTTYITNRVGFNRETGLPDNEVGNGWGCYDLGLQNENLILKAKELGLGTLIMGIRDADRIRAFCNIPENEAVMAVIAVGYAAASPDKPKRKSVEDIAKFY